MNKGEGLGARDSGRGPAGVPGCRPRPDTARPSTLDGPGTSVGDLLVDLAAALEDAGVADGRDEARDMVAALLDVPRFWPPANRDALVDAECRASALAAVSRRAAGAPFAYAVGRAAFRHLTLDVDERVLIPRQETEVLVELVLEATASSAGGTVADVGTGSGAIALALATEGRFERVIGTDVSADALAVARRNAAHLAAALRATVDLRHGSLLSPLAGERGLRAVVSNPPYIAYGEALALPPSVRDWEPALALFSGDNGMAATAAIVAGAAPLLAPGGLLAFEVDTRRASLVAELCLADGRYRDVEVRFDLTGRERFVLAYRL